MSMPNLPSQPLVVGDTRRDQRALATSTTPTPTPTPEVKNLPPPATHGAGRTEGRRGNLKVTGKEEEGRSCDATAVASMLGTDWSFH